jgi:hypothetical protein
MTMKLINSAAAATVLIALLVALVPARADEDCDNVVRDLTEAISIANKNFATTMGELKKLVSEGADDKKKATVKNTFCSASGEMLGSSRAMRAIAPDCAGKAADIASLEKSIKEMETAIVGTCE